MENFHAVFPASIKGTAVEITAAATNERRRVGESAVRHTVVCVEMKEGLLNAFRNYEAVMVK